MQQVMEVLNHDHPICSGCRLAENRRYNVIPLNITSAFDDSVEILKAKDVPVPRYLHDIAERLLLGPDVFKIVGW
jgi:hypothetical protein